MMNATSPATPPRPGTQEGEPERVQAHAGALSGVRVVDLSRVLAGPFCATILADLGAEVVKVETPWGDDSRQYGPYVDGESSYYRLFNRSKLGLSLDLKDPADRDTCRALIDHADVVVENFRPGVMARLGLAPDELVARNPRLIITSISGFGQTGTMASAPAYDLVAQAMSGIMSVTGHPGGPPTRVGISIGDLIPGLYAAIATLAALRERDTSGRGQHIDLAMFDALVSLLESVGMRELHGDTTPQAVGNDHAMTVPFSTYGASDGQVVIAVTNETLFARLTHALGLEWMAQDPRFSTNDARVAHREDVRELFEEALAAYTVEEAVAMLSEHGVPASPVCDVRQALRGPLAQERGVVAVEPDGFSTLASPLRLRGSCPPRPAPRLGQHNGEVADLLARWAAGAAAAEGDRR
ncbi:CoA transferase [Corynebacterium uberis]|uniref:CaiB/BaiF CoA transferase family protein n=2 Tax=Corynebacteriaceae TaxID=1653 RepID=UPI001D0B8431|nr:MULTISPECIES: CoA transferase [Corynebacterium]MCZ9310009.1 CoA transferase [Corynebacterium sp. c6VSa_13]UDL73759.1 CoA transferase [Corynebacterium uberis]UDL75358.1 CoA transferase [Corynebacterium uberis]UDL77569.1 CoA transferase [Corynebacterium uberis]UDL79856.1 CoA transferase [Corynebacterium uberis]